MIKYAMNCLDLPTSKTNEGYKQILNQNLSFVASWNIKLFTKCLEVLTVWNGFCQ